MNKGTSVIFNALIAFCLILTAAVLVTKGIDAYRMSDPDYARMLADREHFEKVVSKSGLPMHPAAYWSTMDSSGPAGADSGGGG